MKKLSLSPAKGFRDFYPQKMAFRRWLFGKMRKVSRLFGYQEYEGPILEPVSLYEAKSGDELVKKQTFQLKDKGGRRLALRPELTPTLARMIAKKQYELPLPIRWFSIGPRFRYEAPQKGRARQFAQWDVDLVGANTPEADAEVIALACYFFQELGLSSKEVVIKVNNRRLMDFKLSLLDIPKKLIPEVFRAIDKQAVNKLQNQGLTLLQVTGLKKILTDKDFSRQTEGSKELSKTFSILSDFGVSSFVEFDPSIVRGLDYYTGTVFEARDRKGKFRAILGGGRYDNLIALLSQGKERNEQAAKEAAKAEALFGEIGVLKSEAAAGSSEQTASLPQKGVLIASLLKRFELLKNLVSWRSPSKQWVKSNSLPAELGGRPLFAGSEPAAKSRRQTLSGVGFACGDMVITEVLKEFNKLPKPQEVTPNPTRVLVTVFGPSAFPASLKLTSRLRNMAVNAEIYPDPGQRLDKQLKYADRKGIPFVVILGPKEISAGKVKLKNMRTRFEKITDLSRLQTDINGQDEQTYRGGVDI